MTIPSKAQIENVANDYVAALGGSAVHLRLPDVMLSIDAAYQSHWYWGYIEKCWVVGDYRWYWQANVVSWS